jgi:hypothetical protein
MIRKFAVALIATTMLVAPAFAADAVKSTSAAPVAAASTPAVTPAAKVTTKTAIKTSTKHLTKTAIKTDKHLKTFKVAHRHPLHVKIAKVSKPVKTVTAAPAPTTWFPWTQPGTVVKPVKTFKVAHHHAHHMVVAKHVTHVKTVKLSKPVKAVTAASSITTPVASTPATKVIKAKVVKAKVVKKIKVAHHGVRHLSVAKNGQHVAHIKIAKVSKPIKHASVGKTHNTHVVAKSSKVIAN